MHFQVICHLELKIKTDKKNILTTICSNSPINCSTNIIKYKYQCTIGLLIACAIGDHFTRTAKFPAVVLVHRAGGRASTNLSEVVFFAKRQNSNSHLTISTGSHLLAAACTGGLRHTSNFAFTSLGLHYHASQT